MILPDDLPHSLSTGQCSDALTVDRRPHSNGSANRRRSEAADSATRRGATARHERSEGAAERRTRGESRLSRQEAQRTGGDAHALDLSDDDSAGVRLASEHMT